MPTVYDVPADELIKKTAEYFRENVADISPPQWFNIVKTSSHVEEPPINPDYWYIRTASILRKIYVHKSIGIAHLRKEYGGRTSRGTVGKHKRRSGGAGIRMILKQLEKAGLIKIVEKTGRILTSKGISTLDTLAGEILQSKSRE